MAATTTGQDGAELLQADKPTKQRKGKSSGGEAMGKLPAHVSVSHAAIERDIHTRHWGEQALVGHTLTLRGAQIHVEPPIDLGATAPPWSRGSGKLSTVELFTDTSKMNAPSFSLPVGPPSFGGSCPGSLGGMTTAPREAFAKQRKRVLEVISATNPGLATAKVPANFDPAYAVCQNCYVSKGHHAMYWGNNLRLVVRYAWTRAMVERDLFAPAIIEALRHTDFAAQPAALAHLNQRYFRIHDAGDFYDKHYLRAWWQIADAYSGKTAGLERISFWAPTRIWATSWGNMEVRAVNGGANFRDNFILRPSGYVINAPGPEFPIGPSTGWASPTTVDTPHHVKQVLQGAAEPAFDWVCPAQESLEGSCLSSPSPTGEAGCRACWVHPHIRTCYKLH